MYRKQFVLFRWPKEWRLLLLSPVFLFENEIILFSSSDFFNHTFRCWGHRKIFLSFTHSKYSDITGCIFFAKIWIGNKAWLTQPKFIVDMTFK